MFCIAVIKGRQVVVLFRVSAYCLFRLSFVSAAKFGNFNYAEMEQGTHQHQPLFIFCIISYNSS